MHDWRETTSFLLFIVVAGVMIYRLKEVRDFISLLLFIVAVGVITYLTAVHNGPKKLAREVGEKARILKDEFTKGFIYDDDSLQADSTDIDTIETDTATIIIIKKR